MDDEDVIAYLESENAYFDAKMAPYQDLIDTIYSEIEGRQPAELTSLPRQGGDWYYQWRYGEGSEYREWLRWPVTDPDAREGPTDNAVVFLSEPELAEGFEYFRLGSLSVSNRGSLAVYSTDTNGTERYTMVLKHLGTGELLGEPIEGDARKRRLVSGRQIILLYGAGRHRAPLPDKAARAGYSR